MSLFDRILTQPILNLLSFIYSFIGDFGVAIIILTVIVRLILWPLVKKQLHQTKIMRAIQPELKRIKKKSNGNRMLESQMMMELYKEKGVKPFSSILVLIVQLPIFISIFRVIQIFSENYQKMQHVDPSQFIYPFLENFGKIPELLANNATHLFGVIDLTQTASNYAPALIIALIAAGLQFWQSKQTMPQPADKRRLRDMFKEAADGKEVDQSEMMAATTGKMIYFMPLMTIMISLALPSAVMLYYAVSSGIAVIQQYYILNKNEEEMEKIASEPNSKPKKSTISKREKSAREAEIITVKSSKNKKAKNSKQSNSSNGKTVVRRIKAK